MYTVSKNTLKKNTIIKVLILIVILVITYIFVLRPIIKRKKKITGEGLSNKKGETSKEGFSNKEAETDKTIEELNAPTFEDGYSGPLRDLKNGVIMDGRGYQPGPMDPAPTKGLEPSGLDTIPDNYYFLDDGDNGRMSIQHNLCSRSCCSDQYPTPFKMKYDPYVCQNKDKFVPSNIMCNNSFQDSGCLCMDKEQSEFLYNRGGNGRDWF